MNENLIKELNAAIKIIGSLPVTHEAQDVVVATKQKIRNVIAELEKTEKPNESGKK